MRIPAGSEPPCRKPRRKPHEQIEGCHLAFGATLVGAFAAALSTLILALFTEHGVIGISAGAILIGNAVTLILIGKALICNRSNARLLLPRAPQY